MSKTVRNRKHGHTLFANSYTNRNRRQLPKFGWEHTRQFQADGAGNYWGTNCPKAERVQQNKKNRKKAKQALSVTQSENLLEWDGFEKMVKLRY